MRFFSAIVLAVVAAVASSISAMPADAAGAKDCPRFCFFDSQCAACPTAWQIYFICLVSRASGHIGAVWLLALAQTRELLVICRIDQRASGRHQPTYRASSLQ
ncbi:uncharacterized protein F5147DRAFT_668349 [Suillus discolor]|uniref:Uncharacterized protein n=1 Tax=Suillus discolor TaxID=1912936 RepID=A0A9P7FK16_9AGAM|nr:uncharacterized protein F5147DRAFT_668349 [Suillus discolor]KAG2119126.1 hypothetical protein F5147DRAFT_668349 [Suillus discolor]